MIEVKGLTKTFGENRAVDDVSFEVERGQIVGLLGPNGAGKTTTMRMLTTYLAPDQGDAHVVGHSIRDEPLEVRRRIGYLPESSPLYLEMAIRPYLNYVASIRGIGGSRRRQRVDEMLHLCGLEDVLDREIGQLSKGYRQRVGLAATLLHDPEFLILDEPTSGLDPNQIVEIRNLIRRVAETKTVFLSTHILSEVEATCDRVIIIAFGKIVADGSAEELTRGAGGTVYTVSVLGERQAAQRALESGGFVQRVEAFGDLNGSPRFKVIADDGGAERIFQLAVDKGLTLVELTPSRDSLEQVFRELTKGGKN